ncbi:MAG: hypothetical protein IPH78_12200 [Bacteroidetes bacterium]|nr:hypothetical protein [Bacteroidota bacterium]
MPITITTTPGSAVKPNAPAPEQITQPGLLGGNDCDRYRQNVWQSATLYIDADNDDYDNGTATVCYGASIPVGYKATTLGSDCNDANASLTTNCSNFTWTGATSTAWNIATNWNPSNVPTATDDVTIPDVTNDPVISTAVTSNDITLASGATLTVADGGSLTLNGTFANSGAVTIQHNGNFLQGTGSSYGGSGTFTVEKTITNPADGYRDISSPVATTVADLADDFTVFGQNGVDCWYSYNPYPNVQVYDEAYKNNLSTPSGNFFTGWISRTGLGNNLNPMQGVAIRTYVSAPFTLDFTGTPNNGPYSRAITNTTSGTPLQDGWNFVGNPYPSNIDWQVAAALNPDITGVYYVFNTTGEYTGNWGTSNGVTSTGLGGISQYIASGQGFFVKATGSGNFQLDNTVRTTAAANFYKTTVLDNEIRLELTGQGNMDEIVAYTDPAATWSEDNRIDAMKIPAGSTVYLSYKQLGKEYAINAINDINETTELPLVIWTQDTGSYTLEATALNVDGYDVYLKDAAQNTLTDLSNNTPSLALNGGQTYEGRYSIVFKKEEVISNIQTTTDKGIRIYSYDNVVVIEKPTTAPAQVSIVNVLGQQLLNTTISGTRTELPMSGTETWYGYVKVTEGTRNEIGKVLIRNK